MNKLYFGSPEGLWTLGSGNKIRLLVAPMARFRPARLVVEPAEELVIDQIGFGGASFLSAPLAASLDLLQYVESLPVICKNVLAFIELRNPTDREVTGIRAWFEGEYEPEPTR